MNKTTTFLMITIAALCFTLGATMQSKAEGKNFASVIPFVTSNDRWGLFDQNSGRIYMYDNNLSECLFEGEVNELGKPIKRIK